MNAVTPFWSPQQAAALDAAAVWFREKTKPVFRIFGYAGTGKTTLARHFAEGIKGAVHYAAFTGKAAMVMRKNGCAGASTIHSLIYHVEVDPEKGTHEYKLKSRDDLGRPALFIIDECSMVDAEIGKDLLSFDVPILVLGDPAQLPPVSDDAGFFTKQDPDVMLTEIHREQSAVMLADQVLVGVNRTRTSYNRRMRELLGRAGSLPEAGDRLVCLKNDREKGLFNGGLWNVLKVKQRRAGHLDDHCVRLDVSSLDFESTLPLPVRVRKEFFEGKANEIPWKELRGTQQFDYGYALTVHKAQGSQWDNVLVFDESFAFGADGARHLYTAITRAAERITVVRS